MKKITSLAPGRTCLFGDHQDYLGLPVIACAIDRNIKLIAKENQTKTFVLNMVDINEIRVIDIYEAFEKLEPRDYFASALRVLRRYGCKPKSGYDITITGDIPINSGTSSSSALLMAWIRFLIEAFGIDQEVTPEFLSKLGYESEVVEHGEPGGMMDHFSIGVGNIVYINTQKPFSFNVIGTELKGLITGVSGVPKETIGLLGELKGNALMAIDIVKQNYPQFDLNTSEIEDLDKYRNCLPDLLIPFFEAAVKNYQYTKEALKEFEKPVLDLKKIGALMNGHHEVLRDLLKITVPRIDAMVNAALKAGAYGAKIVGSGGGGSIVVIADPKNEDGIIKAILDAGAQEAYAVNVDPGVRIIDNIEN
ncbi:galactokinase family protein [Flavobacterium tyrosinilyticum]|uniref:GHMP family kinase ATP-binding protein n=1 Tax=Flavobacterium tyrosinilyticum TaxID=1658740 RepID=UPI00203082F8|nr:galactokinase family protein [Flavobacterium tyrosinilyticum]MCM0666316.1 galactokinase [Flavobacterium tyrosinilyticum]